MKVEPLNRDGVSERWAVESPCYRVDFWHQLAPPPGGTAEKQGFKQDSFRLTDVEDICEARTWAIANAGGRPYVIYLEFVCSGESGVLRLEGVDPTSSGSQLQREVCR